jgi:hypothetical protein
VGERRLHVVAFEQRDVLALRMALDVPEEGVDDRARAVGHAANGRRQRPARRRGCRRLARLRPRDLVLHLAQRPGRRGEPVRQPYAERLLDARGELDARQAVEPEVALDLVVEPDATRRRVGSELVQHRRDDRDQALGVRRFRRDGGLVVRGHDGCTAAAARRRVTASRRASASDLHVCASISDASARNVGDTSTV